MDNPRARESQQSLPAPITRGEWLAVISCALVLAGLAMALVVHARARTPPGWMFSGFIGAYQSDYNSYLAWMRQAYDGHVLFKDLYTTEPHSRVFFLPLFWLIGAFARLTGSGLLIPWYIAQVLGIALLTTAVYRFSAHFTDDRATRTLSLVLATTSAGLGWLLPMEAEVGWVKRPIDLWMAESNLFEMMATSFFTLPIALGLMLLSFSAALSYIDTGRWRDAVASGLYGLALAAVHQYDIVILYAVLAVWGLLAGPRRWPGLVLMAAIPLPYCLYSAAAVKFDPVLSKIEWFMPLPSVAAWLVGFGVPLLLAAASLLAPSVRLTRRVWWLVSWPLVVVVLLFLPIAFNRKLVLGVTVPLCLLAAMGVIAAARWAAARSGSEALRRAIVWAIPVAVVAVCAIGTVQLYLVRRGEALGQPGVYLPAGYFDAMRWLEQHSGPDEAALAPHALSSAMPGRTGLTVFAGHWAATLDRGNKTQFVNAFLSGDGSVAPAQASAILARNRVRWIVTETHRYSGVGGRPAEPPFRPLVELVYQNPTITIWEVAAYSAAGGDARWTGGDWKGE